MSTPGLVVEEPYPKDCGLDCVVSKIASARVSESLLFMPPNPLYDPPRAQGLLWIWPPSWEMQEESTIDDCGPRECAVATIDSFVLHSRFPLHWQGTNANKKVLFCNRPLGTPHITRFSGSLALNIEPKYEGIVLPLKFACVPFARV